MTIVISNGLLIQICIVEVYRELLHCPEWAPTSHKTSTSISKYLKVHPLIATAILRTSVQIHREAYKVMVETNEFVLLNFAGGVDLPELMNHPRVPLISLQHCISAFQGYALVVTVSGPGKTIEEVTESTTWIHNGPSQGIMLARDLGHFCRLIFEKERFHRGWVARIEMSLAIAPKLGAECPRYKMSFEPTVTETTQKQLLRSFRSVFRGKNFKQLRITGNVDASLARNVYEEIMEEGVLDPETVIKELESVKNKARRFLGDEKHDDAYAAWQDAVDYARSIHGGSSWEKLVEQGGHEFIIPFAGNYFIDRIELANHQLIRAQQPMFDKSTYLIMAQHNLYRAFDTIERDYWVQDHEWQATPPYRAKGQYLFALRIRLAGEVEDWENPMSHIEEALTMYPDDETYLREREAIHSWLADRPPGHDL
jgi:hypothetical protein